MLSPLSQIFEDPTLQLKHDFGGLPDFSYLIYSPPLSQPDFSYLIYSLTPSLYVSVLILMFALVQVNRQKILLEFRTFIGWK